MHSESATGIDIGTPPTRHFPERTRFFLWLVGVALLLRLFLIALPASADPSHLPQPALLPNFNPLCDSNLVPCLDIDKYALHVYADLMVLPRTELRDTAAASTYGLTLGVLGRFAGGLSTHSSFWQQSDGLQRAQGPLRLSLTALLWPLLPISQAPVASQDDAGATYFVPPRRLRIGLAFDHEWRVGPFDGPNSLGFLADLAALRLVAVKALGPMEITASVGTLFDWQRTFATGEAAVQLGLYLPFFKALKVYAEAQGRGAPRYVKNDFALPLINGVDPLQAVLGGGLSFRPSERVDLGVSVQRGFGGLAPVAVLVRFLTLSLGETYDHRAASSVAQLAADATSEVASQLVEVVRTAAQQSKQADLLCPQGMQLRAMPEEGDARCIPLESPLPLAPSPLDGHPCELAPFDGSKHLRIGRIDRTGRYCDWDGLRLPLGAIISPPQESPERRHPEIREFFPPISAAPIQTAPQPPPASRQSAGARPGTAPTAPVPSTAQTPSALVRMPAGPPMSPGTNRQDRPPSEIPDRYDPVTSSVPGSPLASGFVDQGRRAIKHAGEIARVIRQHGIGAVVPSREDAKAWLHEFQEHCASRVGECLKEKAQEAADELNEFRQKSTDEKAYTVGGWVFNGTVSAATSAIIPGGGAVFSGVVRTGERAAAKAVGKKLAKKAGEEIIEHSDEAAVRKLLQEAEARAAKEAERRTAQSAEAKTARVAEHAVEKPPSTDGFSVSQVDKKSSIRQNAEKGSAWEAEVVKMEGAVAPDLQAQVTLETKSGARTRMDFVGQNKETGNIHLVEAKSSGTAPLTKNQTRAFPEIEHSGARVVGTGKPGYPGGTVIPPTKVKIVRP